MTKLATEVYLKLLNGKPVPALGLGTVPSGNPADVKDQVKAAIEAGYRHIDTAWYYGTEKYVGEAINEAIKNGIVKREDLFVTTKVWPSYHDNPEASLHESLATLNLDYVDLLLQHWPVTFKNNDGKGHPPVPRNEDGSIQFDDQTDDSTGFVEFYKRIEDLYLKYPEKIKSIGVSNFSKKYLMILLNKCRITPVNNQIEYHPQLPQKDLTDFCKEKGIIVTAYSPVGSEGAPVLQLPLIKELADKYNVSTNEIANAYHILEGRISIPRSSNLDRIKSNIKLPPLTEDELSRLYQIGEQNPTRYVNEEWGRHTGFAYWD